MEEMSTAAKIAMLAIQLGAILFAARFCGELAKKLRVPSVLGELLAGILIGPFVLGSIGIPIHGFTHGLFPLIEGSALPVSELLYGIATIGSIVLLFLSGLETDLRMFFKYSVVGTVVGLGGVIFSFAFGVGIGMVALKVGAMDPRCLFLGILCTATSVGITARILSERKSIDSPEGVTILAAAVIDDVLGIICLAIVMGIVTVSTSGNGGSVNWGNIGVIAVKSFGIWLGATLLGLVLARKIAAFLRWFKSPGIFSILALGLALLVAGLFEQAGLAMIVGAYVMGLSLSKTDISFAVQHALHPIYNFLVPIFFVVMGMLVDVRVLGDMDVLTLGLIYSVLAILAKILGCAIPAWFMNFNTVGALRIGMGMIPRGEVALIIAGIGATTMMANGKPILDPKLFGVGIIMTLMTTLFAPPLLAWSLSLKGKGVRKDKKDTSTVHTVYKFPSEIVTDFVLHEMVEIFTSEGFMHSGLQKGGDMLQLRRANHVFSVSIDENEFVFESNPDEVVIIKAVMYETFVNLHKTLSELKHIARPQEMNDHMFDEAPAANGKSGIHLEKFLKPGCVITSLQSKTKPEIIKELVDLLADKGLVKDKETALTDVMERESIVSTCFQDGIAFPHGRTAGVANMVAAIGLLPEGGNFDAQDGKPTKLFVLMLCPKDDPEPLLQIMARLGVILSAPGMVDNLLTADSPEAVRDLLIKQ